MSRLNDETQAGHAAVSIALDALIQLKQTANPQALDDIYEKRPIQALVLASFGDKSRSPFLRGLIDTAEGENWFAAANLLLIDDRPALTRALLGGLRITAVLYLVTSGGAGGGEASGISIGCGGIGMAPGLPPWAAYDLSAYGSPGMTVLSTGPVPILLPASTGARRTDSRVLRFDPRRSERHRSHDLHSRRRRSRIGPAAATRHQPELTRVDEQRSAVGGNRANSRGLDASTRGAAAAARRAEAPRH